MIFKFRIVSDEDDQFKREIKIDADSTFLDLRNAICESVGYDKNQMSSFFLCDSSWEKEKEITLEDMGLDASEDAYLMDECVLRDFIEDEGQRLMFVFDYMTDRAFFIEMRDSEPGKTLIEPICSLSQGTPPAQSVEMDEFDAAIDAKAAAAAAAAAREDLDEDFYGSTDFNDDEFEAGGFDEMDFN